MAAKDHLSPRLFHSTDEHLKPGDLIQPGYRRPYDDVPHASDDYKHLGHGDFAWASANKPKRSYGGKHYEVEPTGLAHPYTFHEDSRSGVSSRADDPHAEVSSNKTGLNRGVRANNWVSLSPLRVKGRVTAKGEPWNAT